jgi:hypothetical protein
MSGRERGEVPALTGAPNRLIQTSHGPLEYAVLGEGLPLVVMHGSGGGVRQGLLMRYLVDTRRIQIIALSRPGCGPEPSPTSASVRAAPRRTPAATRGPPTRG